MVQSKVSDPGDGESGTILLAGAYFLQKYSDAAASRHDARSHEATF